MEVGFVEAVVLKKASTIGKTWLPQGRVSNVGSVAHVLSVSVRMLPTGERELVQDSSQQRPQTKALENR